MKDYFILMADIVNSREKPPEETAITLTEVTNSINEAFAEKIYSPLTVTLGDEFQGVVNGAKTGIEIMFAIEEYLIKKEMPFKLRYVFMKGSIATPLNNKVAHGMFGKGLTDARTRLNMNKKKGGRFFVKYGKNDSMLNKLLFLYQSVVDEWDLADYKILNDFLLYDDYKIVAEKNSRQPSLMWKRKKSLKIKEYQTIKSLLLDYAL